MDNLVALVLATAVLVMIPGPNVALIVAASLERGPRHGLMTVLGTTVGVAVQLALVVAGLTSLLAAAAAALYWLKWTGAAYLVWLGVRAWQRSLRQPAAPVALPGDGHAFRRGLLLAILNPKTLLFNAAFLPQFVPTAAGAGGELALLAAAYLAVIALGDSAWAVFAGSARTLARRYRALLDRISGSLLVGAGAWLALAARRSA